MSGVSFSPTILFSRPITPSLESYRNELHSKFNRQISLLLESKAPKKQTTNKGRLNTRLAYRTPFSDAVFTQSQSIPSSDTTIIFLVDGSGSMDCIDTYKTHSRMEECSAVTSAFAKSVSRVLKDQLKIEVLVKSAPCVSSDNFGIEGSYPILTRVYSNAKGKTKDYDKLLALQCVSPIVNENGRYINSYTAEYSILPCLMNWAKKNVTTKNIVVFNLTDGETYSSVGKEDFTFKNENTAELKTKYLRGVPNTTLLVGNDLKANVAKTIYGQDLIVNNKTCFVTPMMRTLLKIIDGDIN